MVFQLDDITVTASRVSADIDEPTTLSYQNFEIKSVTIVSKNGLGVDVRLQLVSLELYFDIFSQCSSGRMTITDGNDIIKGYVDRINGGSSTQPLTGFEALVIEIDVKVDSDSAETISLQYRIDKISDIVPMVNGSQIYTIHFVSVSKIRSIIKKVNKSFRNITYSDAIKQIFDEYLAGDLIDLDTTAGQTSFIIPNYRPLQALSWICSKASNETDTNYFFFETANGFKFKSLQNLYRQSPKYSEPYTFGAKIIGGVDRAPQFEIIDYKTKEFDMQSAIISGGIASKMLGVDIFNQTTNLYEENIEKNVDKTLHGIMPYEDADNILENYDAFILVCHEIKDRGGENDNNIQYLLKRAQSMAMLRHFTLRISVPGNWNLSPGDIVEVLYPTHKVPEHQQEATENAMRSGKFLVTAVAHKLINSKMISTLELSSDSLASPPPPKATSDNPIKIEEPSNIPVTNIPNFT